MKLILKEDTQSKPQVENEEQVLNGKMQERIQHQKQDPFCANILKHLAKGNLTPEKPYFVNQDILCRYTKEADKLHPSMVMPCSMIGTVLMEAHDFMGHNGVDQTYALLKKYYYWKGLRSSIAKHIKCCFQCQK